MSRLIKILLLVVAGIVTLLVLTAVALLLFFDPNDYREEIAARVQDATGREMVIEGDLSVSVFPWLAVEVGRTSLGNADGFGDEPFARFDNARLSVRLLPLLLRQEIAVGTAAIDALELNLAVNADGVTNWDDLAAAAEAPEAAAVPEERGGPAGLDIAGMQIVNATIRYRDDATGSRYLLENMSIDVGRVALGEGFEFSSELDFTVAPGDMGGHLVLGANTTISEDFSQIALSTVSLDGMLNGIASEPAAVQLSAPRIDVDLDESRVAPGSLELSALGVSVAAEVEPFSWAGEISVPATVTVSRFSLKSLLRSLDIEAPLTADPNALERVAFGAKTVVSPELLAFESMNLQLDNTSMTGSLLMPLTGSAPIEFDLRADRLNLDSYMAPPEADAAADSAAPADDFEIPVDTIRGLNARGSLRVQEATFSGMTFSNVQLGLTSGSGKLRLNPLSAELFDGSYEGDIRIDASGDTPALSVNERVEAVNLTPLAAAMFDLDKLSGTIAGSFALNARGETLSEMRSRLNGNMTFELADGAWEGTDLWYQLRRARALYKREQPPEPSVPPRTAFSSIVASGTVTDGVFANDDLLAELPFLQLTGNGTVNLVAGEIDYALQARVMERPEFVRGASEEEMAEFTEAMIPVRIGGTFEDPSIRPDIEAMFRQEVEDALEKKGDELKQRLLDRLTRDQEKGEAPPEDERDAEDELKDRLKDLFDR